MCLSGKLDWKRRLHLTLGIAVWGGAVPGAAGSVHPRGVSGNSRWGCATAGLLTWRAQGGSVRRLGTGSRPRALAHLPPQLCVPHSFIFSFYYALEHLGDLLFSGHFWVNFDFCPLYACLFFFSFERQRGTEAPHPRGGHSSEARTAQERAGRKPPSQGFHVGHGASGGALSAVPDTSARFWVLGSRSVLPGLSRSGLSQAGGPSRGFLERITPWHRTR